jgi:hypothetical protein
VPVVFVHGVNVRDSDPGYADGLRRLEAYIRRYIAPEISADAGGVGFLPVYWGGEGVSLAWGGTSRPRTLLLGMGAADGVGLADRVAPVAAVPATFRRLPAETMAPAPPATGGLIAAGATGDRGEPPLTDLTDDELSDVLATAALAAADDEEGRILLTLAADAVAHDPPARAAIAAENDNAAQLQAAARLVEDRASADQTADGHLLPQGGFRWAGRLGNRLRELVDRAEGAPAWAVSHALLEARPKLNELVSRFIGDVLVYLNDRGRLGSPGPIPKRLLNALVEARRQQQRRDAEPIVVLTHSMGGQLVYDAVTVFLADPAYAGVRIDFWAAAASQVGLFEEMKLFLASDSKYGQATGKVPFPDRRRLGAWWNIYDRADVLSFTAKEIVEGIDDEEYASGVPLVGAHSGYFTSPSFFRQMAVKVAEASAQNWYRP